MAPPAPADTPLAEVPTVITLVVVPSCRRIERTRAPTGAAQRSKNND